MIPDSNFQVRMATLPVIRLVETIAPHPTIYHLARVHRVSVRVAAALLGGPESVAARTATDMARRQLLVSLARELVVHEATMEDLAPEVELSLLGVKLRVHQAVLSIPRADIGQAEDVFAWHATLSQIFMLLLQLDNDEKTSVETWPRSLCDVMEGALVSRTRFPRRVTLRSDGDGYIDVRPGSQVERPYSLSARSRHASERDASHREHSKRERELMRHCSSTDREAASSAASRSHGNRRKSSLARCARMTLC
jgi:hypothetical protein